MIARAVGVLLLLGGLSGCVTTERPLSDPAPSEEDRALAGEWVSDRGDYTVRVRFAAPTEQTPKTRLGDQRLMVMTTVTRRKGAAADEMGMEARAFVTKAAGKTFLSTYDEYQRYFQTALYRLTGDTLDLWAMDSTATAEALRQ